MKKDKDTHNAQRDTLFSDADTPALGPGLPRSKFSALVAKAREIAAEFDSWITETDDQGDS